MQNRLTGQLEEEKMQVYVRLGIRLLYKGMKGRMEGNRGMSKFDSFFCLDLLTRIFLASSETSQINVD